MSAKRYLLCVDDEKSVLSSLKQELKASLGADYHYEIAESGEEALSIADELRAAGHELPVVISDQLMPGMKGDQFLIKLHETQPKTRKILLTGQASAVAVGNALNHADLFRFLSKPWQAEDIVMTVQQAIKLFYLDQALESQNRTLRQINDFAQLVTSNLRLEAWSEAVLRELAASLGVTKAVLMVDLPGGAEAKKFIAALEATAGKLSFSLPTPDRLPDLLPVGVNTQVRMSRDSLVVANAQKGEWSNAPYIKANGTKSLFCAPVVKKDHLLGALYLEHTAKADYFTTERQALLAALVGQSALALDNVLLYNSLEERVKAGVEGISDDHETMRESIAYASRIQGSLLPTTQQLTQAFPKHFLIYQPKHVLSGDFYWVAVREGVRVAVVADCTGHGVPGALMSVLGLNLLNTLVLDRNELRPEVLLSQLHKEIVSIMPQSDDGQQHSVQEGMDIAIAVAHPDGKLHFAGARRPGVLFHDDELVEIKADRHSVGDSSHRTNTKLAFEIQVFDYTPGDALYLFSDGYCDQFGAGGKKFSYSRLKELLAQSQKLDLKKQGQTLTNRLAIWQKDTPQTDDICVLGIQL